MANRAGMRRTAAAWVAVPVCHPLSPAPFFPFRGEKKRGGGGQGGDPLSSRGRGRRGGSSPSWGLFSPTDTPVMARSCSPGAHARHGGPASPPSTGTPGRSQRSSGVGGPRGVGSWAAAPQGAPGRRRGGPGVVVGGSLAPQHSWVAAGHSPWPPRALIASSHTWLSRGGRGGTQLRWLPRACAGGLGEGRGGVSGQLMGLCKQLRCQGRGHMLSSTPPLPQNRGFWGAGLQAGEGNGGLPGGLQSPLPAAGPPQALSAPLRGGMQAPPEPPPPQGAAACPSAGAPGWSRGSVWGGFRGWRRLAHFNGRTARAAIKITLINKDRVGGCLQCQAWVVGGGGWSPAPQPHDVPPHWRAAGVPPPRRAPHPVWAAPGGDPHLGDELPRTVQEIIPQHPLFLLVSLPAWVFWAGICTKNADIFHESFRLAMENLFSAPRGFHGKACPSSCFFPNSL